MTVTRLTRWLGAGLDAVPAALPGQASGRRRAAGFSLLPRGTSERGGRSGVPPRYPDERGLRCAWAAKSCLSL